MLQDFNEQLSRLYEKGRRYRLRIVEVGDLSDLEKRALYLRNKYGAASFAIIGGHGSPNEIHLGHTLKGNEVIKREDLMMGEIIRSLFLQDSPIALFSCSTGVRDGIAQTLSGSGVRVTGPDASSSTARVIIREKKGKLHLEVIYRGGKARTYSSGSSSCSSRS